MFVLRGTVRKAGGVRCFTTIVPEDALRPSTTPGSGNVGTLMDSQVVKNHLKRAVHVAEQDGSRWTYGELKRHVDAFALGLLGLNFSSGSRIALALPNNGEFIVASLAAAKVGAVIIPLTESPSRDQLKSVLESGAEGIIFTDRARNTNYGVVLSELVPEVKDFATFDMHGRPFKSNTFPALRQLINTARNRVDGMMRFAWVAQYSFDSTLRRHAAQVTSNNAYFVEIGTNKTFTHGDLMSLASKTFSSLPQNSIISIARPMDSAAAFAAGLLAPQFHGALSACSESNDSNSLGNLVNTLKPQAFIGDSQALSTLLSIHPPSVPVPTLCIVGNVSDDVVSQAKSFLKADTVKVL